MEDCDVCIGARLADACRCREELDVLFEEPRFLVCAALVLGPLRFPVCVDGSEALVLEPLRKAMMVECRRLPPNQVM